LVLNILTNGVDVPHPDVADHVPAFVFVALSAGSVFASVTWLAGSALLSFYLANYANYDATYGSLGAAIAQRSLSFVAAGIALTAE
jgi:uncharacterized BrkB/YihY/UPF0761 family membrane protein